MNGKDLLNGLSYVEDELIQEAEQKSIKKSFVKFLIPMAASLAIISASFLLWTNHENIPPILPDDNNIPPIANDSTQYTLHFNHTDGQSAKDIYIEGHFWEELTSEQAEIILPLISEKYQVDGMVNYSQKDENTTIFSIDTNIKMEEKRDMKITIAPNEIAKCYIINGEPILSEIEGITIEAGIFTATNNGKVLYYADFKIDNVAYYVEFVGEEEDKAFFTNIVADIILGGKADLSIFNPIVPELRDDRLTEDEAYAENDFGAYLLQVPDDYAFNDATRFINQTSNYLFASWSQGFDDIRVIISNLNEEDKERIVSINDTELYDMSLYPIPWYDSMPRNKSHIIENPIFKIEELALDVVKMRGYFLDEQGDTNNLNMRFSVLYGDIVVDINTEGVNAEYLFEKLTSLPR